MLPRPSTGEKETCDVCDAHRPISSGLLVKSHLVPGKDAVEHSLGQQAASGQENDFMLWWLKGDMREAGLSIGPAPAEEGRPARILNRGVGSRQKGFKMAG